MKKKAKKMPMKAKDMMMKPMMGESEMNAMMGKKPKAKKRRKK